MSTNALALFPLEFVVEQLASNPQHVLDYDAFKEPFRAIINELNSISISTQADSVINSYEQLIKLTQSDHSWRKILQQETESTRTTFYPKIYQKLQELCKKLSCSTYNTTRKPITHNTSYANTRKTLIPSSTDIINNTTNPLKAVKLIQNRASFARPIFIFSRKHV